MKNLQRLLLALSLTSVLTIAAFAGDMDSPPSAPGCAPGEMSTPPCSSASASNNDSAAPGEMPCPPSDAVDLIGIAGALRELLLF